MGQQTPDLNEMIRDIVRDLIQKRGWTNAEAGRRLGLPQQTLQAYLTGKHGLTLANLHRLIASQNTDVVRFLRRHPTLKARTSARAEDTQRLAAMLSPEHREYLARTLEILEDRHALGAWIESTAAAILPPAEFEAVRTRSRTGREDRKS